MKKTMFAFLVLLAVFFPVFAKEGTQGPKERFSLSWSASYDGQPEAFSRISVIGFGFVLYQNDSLHIRNEIEFSNGVMIMEDLGIKKYKKVLGEKISIGTMTHGNLFRPYGFLGGGVGTSGEDLWNPLENPVTWNFGLGFGIDIFATENWSFFQEMGFLGNIQEGEFIPQQRFELGVMVHF